MQDAWKNPSESYVKELMRERLPKWRRQPVIIRIDKPTRIDKARKLGYKAKTGYVVARIRVRRGSRRKPRFKNGRDPKKEWVLTKFQEENPFKEWLKNVLHANTLT